MPFICASRPATSSSVSTAFERLMVGGGSDFALIGHHGQKGLHILCAHVTQMPHAAPLRGAPADEKADPVQVRFFSLEAIVQTPNPLAHLIEQAGRLQGRHAGFHEKFIPVYLYGIYAAKPICRRV